MTDALDAFLRGAAEAERAVVARPPLTAAERAAGWEEDPGGSGLRRNRLTGEWDDRLLLGAPAWYRRYRAALAGRR